MIRRVSTLLGGVALLASPVLAIDFYNIATVDTAALGVPVPGSVAWNGTDLYVGSLFTNARVTRIANPLGSPSVVGTFGSGPATGTTNGFVSLDIYGNTIVAATNNGGTAPDVVQTFDLAGNPIAAKDSAMLSIPGAAPNDRIDGAGVDPGWIAGGGAGSGIAMTAFGSGRRWLYDNALNFQNNSVLTGGTIGSGMRDVEFDASTGDMYIRLVNGVLRGKRVGANNFAQLDGVTPGFQTILNVVNGSDSALNVGVIPNWGGSGINAILTNQRSFAGTPDFFTRVLVTSADTPNTFVTSNWFNADGTGAFAPADSSNGIYDFSYDAASGILAVSDHANGKVYFFSPNAIPEPTSLLLLGMGAVALLRRR